MSLGFARDSVLDLAALVRENESNGIKHSFTPELKHSASGDTDDLPLLIDEEDDQLEKLVADPVVDVAPISSDKNSKTTTTTEQYRDDYKNKKTKQSTATYEGFSADYAQYEQFYSSNVYTNGFGYDLTQATAGGKKTGLLCCLFGQWNLKQIEGSDDGDDDKEEEDNSAFDPYNSSRRLAGADVTHQTASTTMMSASDDVQEEKKGQDNDFDDEANNNYNNDDEPRDDISTDTDIYGEKLTDKDRRAVLARLRLMEATSSSEKGILDSVVIPSDTTDNNNNNSTEPSTVSNQPPTTLVKDNNNNKNNTNSTTPQGDNTHQTTTKTTTTETTTTTTRPMPKKGILKRSSAILPMATMKVTHESADPKRRSLFPAYETPRSYDIQSSNSESAATAPKKHLAFAPMARVVTVKSRNDMSYIERSMIWWQRNDYDDFKKTGRIIAKAILEGSSEIWLAGKTINMNATKNRQGNNNQDCEENDVASEKWWCQFGHSRRGLEHVANMDEGRQRQHNVNIAIKAILNEQRRQKMQRRPDAHKIGLVAQEYTKWARQLALAAGHADEEAVRTNFSSKANNRTHYLGKSHHACKSNLGNQTPQFMNQMLDEYTSSSIRFRNKEAAVAAAVAKQKQKLLKSQQSDLSQGSDGTRHDSDYPMARQAAGFGGGPEDTRMSSVIGNMLPSRIGAH